jgi:hypothetical protein
MKGCHWHQMYYEKKFCVLQKKVLSFGLNRTVEVRSVTSATINWGQVTSVLVKFSSELSFGGHNSCSFLAENC